MEQLLERQELEQESKDLVADAKSLTITSPEKYEFAGTLLVIVEQLEKKVRTFFDPDIKKAHDLHKSMIKTRDTMLKPVEQASAILRAKRIEFKTRIAEKQRQEEEKNGKVKTAEPPKTEGISDIDVWTFEIVDENLVPDIYKIIDEKKLGQIARSLKDKAQVPGVRFFSRKSERVVA
jgi:ribosomal protein L14E/L6E/L27E